MLSRFRSVLSLLFGVFALLLADAAAASVINSAEVTKLSCTDFTLRVAGLASKGYEVHYSFTLTPGSGPATVVSGKIPVDQNFDIAVTGSLALATGGTYSGAGTATLKDSAGNMFNTVSIGFGGVTPLVCPSPPTPKVSIRKFTNGHDGDNLNGVPTAGQGDFMATNTVAQIPAGNALTWTYRVTNTGSETLVKLLVEDNRIGTITTCPKSALAVGESMDCTVTTTAGSLVFDGTVVVQGCGDGRPTYNNTGKVTAEGQSSGTTVVDTNPSHYCNPPPAPACNLSLSKTCEIVQSTGADWASCRGKLQSFSLIWPSTGGTIQIGGIANDAPGGVVNPGQRVTFTGPWSTNDLFLNISGAASGRSTFHVSCSDKDMDGLTLTNLEQTQLPGKTQDCGKFAGNGKAVSGTWVNSWLVDGMVDAEGKVLNCSPAPTPPTSSCSFQEENPPQCGTGGSFKPTTLTFQYTGGGCSTQSNSQAAGKTSCSGQINPLLPVTVTPNNGDGPFTVAPGGTFTVNRNQTETIFTLSNAGGTETDRIHTSCSQPLIVGDVYFSLTLVAEDGVGVGKQVKYSYGVTNNGSTTVTGIGVTDDKLGAIGSIASLAPGATQTLSATTLIGRTTTNVATATAAACPAPGVQATATVTVLAPPPCTVSESFDSLSDDKIVYKVKNAGQKVVTLDTLTLNFPSERQQIKEVKLDGAVYKADQSSLDVTSGVTIGAAHWTNPDVGKRQLNPGETRNLEIVFTKKAKATPSAFSGSATFKEGCTIDLAP